MWSFRCGFLRVHITMSYGGFDTGPLSLSLLKVYCFEGEG